LAEWFLSTRPTDFAEPPSTAGISGAAGPLALALGGVILLAHMYAELPTLPAALLAISAATAAGRLPSDWPANSFGRIGFRVAITLLLLVLAIAIAGTSMPDNPYAS
jgi:hypothetical protein